MSREDSIANTNQQKNKKSVSFYSTGSHTTVATAESEPLSVDLSHIQHFDMFPPALGRQMDQFDKTPKPPSRPDYTDEDVEEEGEYHNRLPYSHDDLLQGFGDDVGLEGGTTEGLGTTSIMDTHTSSTGDGSLLGPLLETEHDESSTESSKDKTPPQSNVGNSHSEDELFEQICHEEFAFAQACLERLGRSNHATAPPTERVDDRYTTVENVAALRTATGSHAQRHEGAIFIATGTLPAMLPPATMEDEQLQLPPLNLDHDDTPRPDTDFLSSHQQQPMDSPGHPSPATHQDYSLSLMQDCLMEMEWEPDGSSSSE